MYMQICSLRGIFLDEMVKGETEVIPYIRMIQ